MKFFVGQWHLWKPMVEKHIPQQEGNRPESQQQARQRTEVTSPVTEHPSDFKLDGPSHPHTRNEAVGFRRRSGAAEMA